MGILVLSVFVFTAFIYFNKAELIYSEAKSDTDSANVASVSTVVVPTLDTALYDRLMIELANYPVKKVATSTALLATSSPLQIATTTIHVATTTNIATSTIKKKPWPADAPYPNVGAVLPFDRIVAYYGNFYSGALGVLGAYPPEKMLEHLLLEVQKWQLADPDTHVIPALDYIAVVAQGSPGVDGMYRARMPASELQKAVDLANTVNGLVILDVQVGKSTVQKEIPLLEDFLKLPNVELALDPEFSMKTDIAPGRVIGTLDADDINYTAGYLAQLVNEYQIPPKVLIIHRFTEKMLTHYKDITPLPEVQMLIDMDGYGGSALKMKAYNQVVTEEPVQFAGLKLFYKNDVANGGAMMTTGQVMGLQPRPSFIQYQ